MGLKSKYWLKVLKTAGKQTSFLSMLTGEMLPGADVYFKYTHRL